MKTPRKYDSKVVNPLILRIEEQLKKPKQNRSNMSLTLKEINIIKAVNPKFSQTLNGGWNGYGYENLGKHLFVADFLRAKSGLKKLNTEEKKVVAPISEEEKTEKWSARLAKLGEIPIEEARKIAEEKIEYKQDRIEAMMERQYENSSIRRDKLISKMERENPLRRIKDENHAANILAASKRHTETDYEEKLEEGRELAAIGEIDRENVKEYARENFA